MLRFNVDGMSCDHCVRSVTKAIQSVDSRAEVKIDLAAKTVEVQTGADRQAVSKAITDAGYGVVAA